MQMNTIERQQEIMSGICELMLDAGEGEYDELLLELELNAEKGWCKFTFSQTVDGESKSLPMPPEEQGPTLLDLSLRLHKEMMSHTGGDWTKLILRMNKAGRATADFEYGEAPQTPFEDIP